MLKSRVIPTLLLKNSGLVKGEKFRNHKYIGDPINAVKIFNEKEVDELVFLDISASEGGRGPNYDLISDIATETFMPLGYGGGITSIEQIEKIFSLGVEKIIINSSAYHKPELIKEASEIAGAQSIVVSIDVKKKLLGGYEVYTNNGKQRTKKNPIEYAVQMQKLGAGELILCSIDQEGTEKGYDINLIKQISTAVDIPVIASGGAGKLADFLSAVNDGHASAVAAGSMFVFHGKHKAVLITYPKYNDLEKLFTQETVCQ